VTDIFKDKTLMPPAKEVCSVAMIREETPSGTPRLSGERHWPDRAVENVKRPRRGHDY
jgi:hypothetical protein